MLLHVIGGLGLPLIKNVCEVFHSKYFLINLLYEYSGAFFVPIIKIFIQSALYINS